MYTSGPSCAILVLLGAGLAAATIGCAIPTSEQPLAGDTQLLPETELLGLWEIRPDPGRQDAPADRGWVLLGRDPDSPEWRAAAFGLNSEQVLQPAEQFAVRATQIGPHRYFSIRAVDASQPGTVSGARWLLLRIETLDDELALYGMNRDAVVRAIEDGSLRGVVQRSEADSRRVTAITIQATTDELRTLVEEHADRWFATTNPLRLARVGRPRE